MTDRTNLSDDILEPFPTVLEISGNTDRQAEIRDYIMKSIIQPTYISRVVVELTDYGTVAALSLGCAFGYAAQITPYSYSTTAWFYEMLTDCCMAKVGRGGVCTNCRRVTPLDSFSEEFNPTLRETVNENGEIVNLSNEQKLEDSIFAGLNRLNNIDPLSAVIVGSELGALFWHMSIKFSEFNSTVLS